MKRVRHWRGRREPDRLPFSPRRLQTRSHSVKTSTPYGTLIRERKDGVLYFTAKDEKGVSRHWTVTPDGKTWLAGQDIRDGKRAPGQIITALIRKGYARPSENDAQKRGKPKNTMESKFEKLVRDTRRFEERRAANRKSMEDRPPRRTSERKVPQEKAPTSQRIRTSRDYKKTTRRGKQSPKPGTHKVTAKKQAITEPPNKQKKAKKLDDWNRARQRKDKAISSVIRDIRQKHLETSGHQSPTYTPGVPRKIAKKALKRKGNKY